MDWIRRVWAFAKRTWVEITVKVLLGLVTMMLIRLVAEML